MKSKKRTLGLVSFGVVLCVLIALGIFIYVDQTTDRSGWMERDGVYYYLDTRGKPTTGWVDDGDSRYYFASDGAMVTGWQEIDGMRYWFSPAGVMRTGWVEENGERWYLLDDGQPVTGWRYVDAERRYFLSDGRLATGWTEVEGSRYYLNGDGIVYTGWLVAPEGTYHMDDSGHMSTGLTYLDGNAYYFFEGSGLMLQGWLDIDENSYYFGEDGIMVTGWQQVDGQRRYFGADGALHTGWLEQGEYRYYLKNDGTPVTEPTVIDGEQCFFTPEGIYVLLVNYKYGIPDNYKVDLVRYGEWSRVAAIAEDHLRQMILDCRATGVECWLNCGYRTLDEQIQILDDRTKEYMEDKGWGFDYARAEALKTVAVPGYSEHQTGLAMDVVCSVAPTWLQEHCWEYGFILRYPEGKSDITNISYEHWHYRYVGTEVSMAMKDTGLCLEEYLGAA